VHRKRRSPAIHVSSRGYLRPPEKDLEHVQRHHEPMPFEPQKVNGAEIPPEAA